ncbi:hypothetical protein GCM10025867_46150 (plasmid) [Frondihabitans sucicola]|uniref:Uncharacterized protein n=1 Tax=Frondihabitans sucicola TaxID=1268041 RepID=A0ABM8GV82_9MICO|nr:hypothetical protein [Frondihabitans sucicola]BDZ52374.1 hypothetical protein GCM10025867_46150 [Frondihabitans sucicola]
MAEPSMDFDIEPAGDRHEPAPPTPDEQRAIDAHSRCDDCGGIGHISTMYFDGRETTEPCSNPLHAAIVRWARTLTSPPPRVTPTGELTIMSHESTGFCFCGAFHGDLDRWEPWDWQAWWERFGDTETAAAETAGSQ